MQGTFRTESTLYRLLQSSLIYPPQSSQNTRFILQVAFNTEGTLHMLCGLASSELVAIKTLFGKK